eukprot:gnl/TRDRNA2_/TRDRNA2_97583_c0_seq1.p1 gnl/TRDRNA2_/TRDRNA2_97583_c0~~gnl/TRDRNA2_/TRDRNA2_97583_c0_seq1.p1  ORF type:complete len:291 (-),score=47.37 gnl/TRDRNA2_/TRDRNA2_97583_c0_seq1:7-879(-)
MAWLASPDVDADDILDALDEMPDLPPAPSTAAAARAEPAWHTAAATVDRDNSYSGLFMRMRTYSSAANTADAGVAAFAGRLNLKLDPPHATVPRARGNSAEGSPCPSAGRGIRSTAQSAPLTSVTASSSSSDDGSQAAHSVPLADTPLSRSVRAAVPAVDGGARPGSRSRHVLRRRSASQGRAGIVAREASGAEESRAEGLRAYILAVMAAAQEVPTAPSPCSPRYLQALEVSTLLEVHADCCAICLEAMAAGQSVAKLPCRHCFHVNCIKGWLPASLTCPLCKHSLATA